jgi:hypothetical protein
MHDSRDHRSSRPLAKEKTHSFEVSQNSSFYCFSIPEARSLISSFLLPQEHP